MKKMIKHHRGRVRLKEKRVVLAQEEQSHQVGKENLTHDQHSTILAEDDEDEQAIKGTKPPGPTKRRRSSVDVEEGHRGGGFGSSRECDAEEHVPRNGHPVRKRRGPRTEKGSKDQGAENIKNYGQQVMSVRIPEGFVRRSTEQVADVRRLLVSASHIIHAGNDLFIGKNEAYIMNWKKKEKSMLVEEENAYVLDLFVRVPPSVTAPVTYTPMEVDAINQVADERERGRRVTFDCNSSTCSTAGGVSVEDRSKRTGAARPQLDERCEE